MTFDVLHHLLNQPAIEEKRACFTGGEPLLHDLTPLLRLFGEEWIVHIETSGTKPLEPLFAYTGGKQCGLWITCSPKQGFLEQHAAFIDEWKFLLSPSFDLDGARRLLKTGLTDLAYIQPIGSVDTLDQEACREAVLFVKEHPEFRLSLQTQKILRVR